MRGEENIAWEPEHVWYMKQERKRLSGMKNNVSHFAAEKNEIKCQEDLFTKYYSIK